MRVDVTHRGNTVSVTSRKVTYAINDGGRRGAKGERGPKGDKGDQGDPATNLVQSVNGKQGVVVLNAADVSADASGSASQALQDAKDYTDGEVSALDSSLATVAKTGSYNDLSNKPTIPSIAGLATEAQVQDVQDNLDAHEADTANPHSVTKAQVGLGNADNTSDANKPVSAATQIALDNKADLVDGKVPESQLPSFVDDVLTYNTVADFPATGEDGKIYIAKDTNLTYRWTGSAYAEISPSLALGETSSTAYRGDRGKTAYDHTLLTNNPHSVTKAQVGLSNVENLSPADLPVSTAQQTALNTKANASDTVNLTGDQTVAGVKTFTSAPIAPSGTLIGGVLYLTGNGFPQGVVSASVGSIYIDKAITNGASSWIKKSGTGNTGWQVLEGDTGWRDISTSLKTGFTNTGGGYVRVRRIGASVFYEFRIGATSVIAGTPRSSSAGILSMPTGFLYPHDFGSISGAAKRTSSGDFGQFTRSGTGINMWLFNSPGNWTTGEVVTGSLNFAASDDWPSTLPGVSA